MSWFKRSEQGIQTRTEEKKDIPKGTEQSILKKAEIK